MTATVNEKPEWFDSQLKRLKNNWESEPNSLAYRINQPGKEIIGLRSIV